MEVDPYGPEVLCTGRGAPTWLGRFCGKTFVKDIDGTVYRNKGDGCAKYKDENDKGTEWEKMIFANQCVWNMGTPYYRYDIREIASRLEDYLGASFEDNYRAKFDDYRIPVSSDLKINFTNIFTEDISREDRDTLIKEKNRTKPLLDITTREIKNRSDKV